MLRLRTPHAADAAILLGLALGFGLPVMLRAQTRIEPGLRIRARTTAARVSGTVVDVTDTALLIRDDDLGATMSIPLGTLAEARIQEKKAFWSRALHGNPWIRVPVAPFAALESRYARAQTSVNPHVLLIGERIRYGDREDPGRTKRMARVLFVEGDTLTIMRDAVATTPERVSWFSLQDVKVSRGWSHHPGKWSLVFCGVGALAGGLQNRKYRGGFTEGAILGFVLGEGAAYLIGVDYGERWSRPERHTSGAISSQPPSIKRAASAP